MAAERAPRTVHPLLRIVPILVLALPLAAALSGPSAPALAADALCDRSGEVSMDLVRAHHFTPACARVESGGTITWINRDMIGHDPQSLESSPADRGACFWMQEAGGAIAPGDSASVTFHYDGSRAWAVAMAWGEPRVGDCTGAIVPELTTAQTATLRYRCHDHPSLLVGLVAVDRA